MKIYLAILFTLGCFISLTSATCITTDDCSNKGACNNGTCKCDDGYVTHASEAGCNYEQKEKLTAFLLSFLIGNTGL